MAKNAKSGKRASTGKAKGRKRKGSYHQDQAKLDAKNGGALDSGIGSNGFDASKVPDFVGRIENVQAEIDQIMQDARDKCAPLREDIASIKKEAGDESNIPRRELNTKISERRLRAKADALREKLSEEQQNNFDRMSQALGELKDLPLGIAARQAAGETVAEAGAVTH